MNSCAICGKQLISTTDICLSCLKQKREEDWYDFIGWLVLVQQHYNRDRFYESWELGKIHDGDQELETYRENLSYDEGVWALEEDFQWYWERKYKQ